MGNGGEPLSDVKKGDPKQGIASCQSIHSTEWESRW
jgi:hypothetical protein